MKKGEHKGRPAPGDRGLYDFAHIVDTYGNLMTVRSSSGIGAPRAWIFTKHANGEDTIQHCGKWVSASPLLGLREAKLLRDALDRFIEGNTT